jgi:site-specific recombinase
MENEVVELSSSDIEWRYTARRVRVGPFDAAVVLPPLLLFAMRIRWWTFFLAIFTIMVLYVIELFFQLPLPVALRSIRSYLAGRRRYAVPWWKMKSL